MVPGVCGARPAAALAGPAGGLAERGPRPAARRADDRSADAAGRARARWCPRRRHRGLLVGGAERRGGVDAPGEPPHRTDRRCPLGRTPDHLPEDPAPAVGESFVSRCAPAPASAVEAELRAALHDRLDLTFDHTAIRLDRPFHEHVEVWPDIVLPELRVAIEYDSTGRHGLEHVGSREDSDRRKDRATRAVGWEVVRIRTGRLPALGPWDLQVSGVSGRTVDRLVDVLREIRGPLFVDAYAR